MTIMHSMKKRFIALLMTLAMALSFTATAFAAEPTKAKTAELTSVSEEASTRSAGDVIASNATTIYNGSGVLYVTLPTWNMWADLQAGIGYTSQSGVVNVTVTTPSGEVINLGSISGSGSRTNYHELTYAPAGTYAFYFSSAISSPMEVIAYIFD